MRKPDPISLLYDDEDDYDDDAANLHDDNENAYVGDDIKDKWGW